LNDDAVALASLALPCIHYADARCRSCDRLPLTLQEQLAEKTAECVRLLSTDEGVEWLPAAISPVGGFRNKAKMAVSGSADAPRIGLADATGLGVDLRDCPLYPSDMQQGLSLVAEFITQARIEPYDIPQRQGELKHVLLTRAAPGGAMMLRFVLRSQESLARIRKHLPWLRERWSALQVVSANLLPEHKAALEGEREILLGDNDRLALCVNGVPLYLRPRCFFQTNDVVASALYAQVRDWCAEIDPPSLWDLYCGVGGFALHCADGRRTVTGVETRAEAIACAEDSRRELGTTGLRFLAMDATAFALAQPQAAAMLIVNPPRRGLGAELCSWIDRCDARWLVYSSCNAHTLAADLARMPRWKLRRARLFDMFPHTHHYEVATLLQKVG
jgi:23S rRNA (uracil747-C5)-methyltransferase